MIVFVVVGVGVFVVKYGNCKLLLNLGVVDMLIENGIDVMVGFEVVE